MKRITRDRFLTTEEADKYQRIREQVEKEFPKMGAENADFKHLTDDEERVTRSVWRDKGVTLPPNWRRSPSGVNLSPRRTFIQWVNYRFDEIVSMGVLGFMSGCGILALLFGSVLVYALFKFIQYLGN